MQPLEGLLVVELARHLPGPFAGRELLRLGAHVVRVEPPGGDVLEQLAAGWFAALNGGKERVSLNLKSDEGRTRVRELCRAADVLLEGFRPGVAERLGLGYEELAAENPALVYCSLTGFGAEDARAGHDLNYMGYAGALADTAPALPPVQAADLTGALRAVVEILAALMERTRTGRGRRLVVSLTEAAYRLVAHRAAGDPFPRLLTGGAACYRVYATADGRYLTVAALEAKFFARLCALLGRDDLAARQYDPTAQEELALELADVFRRRTLAEWVELFDGEDVAVGPVLTLAEAERSG